MPIDLAKLVVTLEAESAKLQSDLEKANGKLSRFEKRANKADVTLKSMAKTGVKAFGLINGVLGLGVTAQLNYIDKLGKLETRLGISTEALSQLNHVANLSNVSFDTMTMGLQRMTRRVAEAANGTGEAVKAIQELGLSATELNQLAPDQQFEVLADAIDGVENSSDKVRIAMKLFDSEGVALLQTMKGGAAAIRDARKEADELGLTIDGKLSSEVQGINDDLTILKGAVNGAFLQAIKPAIPIITDITKELVAWSKETDSVEVGIGKLGDVFKGIASEGIFVYGVLESIGIGFGGIGAAIVSAAEGDFSMAADILSQAWDDSDKAFEDSLTKIEEMWQQTPKAVASNADNAGKQLASPVTVAGEIVDKSTNDIASSIKVISEEMEEAIKKSASISEEFEKRLSELVGPALDVEPANVIDVGLLETQAKSALNSGDIDGATDKLRTAFDVLDKLKDSGTESSLVLEGLGNGLKRVADEITEQNIVGVGAKVDIDDEQSRIEALTTNQQMQEILNQNPLIQRVVLQQQTAANDAISSVSARANETTRSVASNVASSINGATAVSGQPSLQPVVLNMPGGGQHTVFGDPGTIDRFAREIQNESGKRGKRT